MSDPPTSRRMTRLARIASDVLRCWRVGSGGLPRLQTAQRKLATILAADAIGYIRLAGRAAEERNPLHTKEVAMKLYNGVFGLSLLLSAMAAVGLPAFAAELKAKSVVLVHGAFADGSSWHKVIPYLESAGLKVIAVQNPLDSLENDVAATRRAIRNAEGPVVLVGHSWAGAVITEAGNDDKVKSLVYVAAYAPDKGQSVETASSKYPNLESLATFVKDPDGYLTISDEGIKKYFAADLSAEEQAVVAATQGPFHVRTLSAPVSQAAWREKPTFMVVATNDTIIPPQMEKDQVKAANATAIEVPSSHVAMLSHPKEVAELIIKAAE
jgi:pimeloyl-ACP methyl ester carboxylesterase